jgi:seryl-tRNA(Sec) selenium transferase
MYEDPMSKIYRDLGIEPIINATGTYTAYSGSLMHPEVSDAMNQASRAYVVMEELHLAAGRRIAELIGVEAAHVCASATAGVALMGAACVAGCDRERIRRLPDIDGLKDEFIIQRTQRNSYEQAVRLSGGHFVEIEPDPEALRQAINGKTAGIFYIYSWSLVEPYIPLREAAEIAHAHGVPMIVDAASELPPVDNLRRFLEEGADLVVFSGGKGLRGP